MRITATLILSFIAFRSTAQLNELIISSVFKTGIPHIVNRPIQVCRSGMIFKDSIRYNDTVNPVLVSIAGIEREPKQVCISGEVSAGAKQKIKEYDGDTMVARKAEGERTFTLRCDRTLSNNNQPLIIVNGSPFVLNSFNTINPDDIESISILKSAEATAIYGPDGTNGAIIVIMKSSYKQFVVIDSIDKTPVGHATIGLTMQNGDNTMYYVADDQGYFQSNSPKEFDGLKMTVSAVGYENSAYVFDGNISKYDTLRLKRNVTVCSEVIVSGTFCPKKIVFLGKANITKADAVPEKEPFWKRVHVFPNPVQKGAWITISPDQFAKAVRILNSSGIELTRWMFNSGQSKLPIQVQADPRWASGIYFVQLIYNDGRFGTAEKIVIQ